MIRKLIFVGVALAAVSCRAAILSQLTLTYSSPSEPVSVSSGTFGTYAVSGIVDLHTESPFVANTDYYVPFGDLQLMNEMVTHPEMYDSHGPVFVEIEGTGLGSNQPHYDRLGENVIDSICSLGQGPCSGTLTIAGSPQVYTVPWNEVKMRYTYTPAAAGGYVTSMVVTISNVPEPYSEMLVAFGMIVASLFGFRWRRVRSRLSSAR